MNPVPKHDTDKECNICNEGKVITQYGRYSCDNNICPASKYNTGIEWDSSDEEIEAWQKENNPSTADQLRAASDYINDARTYLDTEEAPEEVTGQITVIDDLCSDLETALKNLAMNTEVMEEDE